MIVQAKGFDNEVQFKFYTYDPVGRDVVIPIFATDIDSAWAKFDRIYGKDIVVDFVRWILFCPRIEMIEVNKTYKWENHDARVTAVYGDTVYYVDQFGCYFRKSIADFKKIYVPE